MRILDMTLKGLLVGLAVVALGACDDGDTDTEDTEVDDTADTSDTSDTGNSYAEPYWFQMTGWFGYNVNGTFIGFGLDATTETSPTMMIDLFEDDGGAPGADICTITITEAGPITEVTTLGGVGVITGFQFGSPTITHDCDGKVDPAKWPSDMQTALAAVDFGAAITAALPPAPGGQTANDLKDLIDADTGSDWATEWEAYIIGCAPYSSIFGLVQLGSPAADVHFTRGFALDFTNTTTTNSLPILIDPPQLILASDVIGGPVSGEFDVITIYALNFGQPLDEVFFP